MNVVEHSRSNDRGEAEKANLRWGPGSSIGIIGGLGEMGTLFSRFFRDRGYRVNIADLDTEYTCQSLVEACDIILFAVPIHLTIQIIREVVPHTRPDQLLMDLTSLKVDPLREMLRSQASVVGLHPMFGGRVSSFSGQTLVACPARIREAEWKQLVSIFEDAGMRIKECTPEDHDRMMSIIQVLIHMTTMLTGRVLREMGVDIAETLEYTSPSYRLEVNIVGRMFAQSPALYSAITQLNPYTKEILAQLKDGLTSYERWYESGDLSSFIRDFEQSAMHLGGFCRGAYEESSALLDFVVNLAQKNDRNESSG